MRHTHPRATVRCRRRDRGSAVVETVIGVPAFILFVGLIIAAGRVSIAQQAVESAAADAARAASIARTSTVAAADGRTSAAQSLAAQQVGCVSSQVAVDVGGFRAPAGTPAQVTATVSCDVNLANLLPFLPGSRTLTATMTSPVDTYRQRS